MRVNNPTESALRKFIPWTPGFIAIPVLYGAVFAAVGYPIDWRSFAIGTGGWIVALILRTPIALLLKNQPRDRGTVIIGSASGPLEEGIRVIALLLLASGQRGHVLSLGLGWASIEIVYTIANGIAIGLLLQRTDAKAVEARSILTENGMLDHSTAWGIVERIFASAFHIGSTLVLATNPWLVLLMAPLHTGLNLGTLRLIKSSFRWAMGLVVTVGSLVFITGFIL